MDAKAPSFVPYHSHGHMQEPADYKGLETHEIVNSSHDEGDDGRG